MSRTDAHTVATAAPVAAGYQVNTRDSTSARLAGDLPVSDLLQELEDLDEYREAAWESLSAARPPGDA
jgi:hypothetical protein